MRDLDAAVITALSKRQLKRRTFFSITARDRTTGDPVSAYFWNDIGTYTFDVIDGLTGGTGPRTFTGSGLMISVSTITLMNDLSVRSVDVLLANTNDEIDAYVRLYDLKNAYVEIHRGLFNPANKTLVAALIPVCVGFVDGCSIVSPSVGSKGQVRLAVVTHTRELTRAGYAVRSHEDQKRRDASDVFFQYAGVIGKVQLFWGEEKQYTAAEVSGGGFRRRLSTGGFR